jgi:TadE-like protein
VTRLHLPFARRASRAQSLVEFAVALPIFMVLLLGMLEFGFVFTHHLGLEYATREGARMGAALANGTSQVPCTDVDNNIIASLQRVVTSPGSQVNAARINSIQIYDADSAGLPIGSAVNTWIPGSDGTVVDGSNLMWKVSSVGWNACTAGARKNGSGYVGGATPNTDSIGVSVNYTYNFVTPLGGLLHMFGAGQLTLSDRTTMALNPSAG